MTDLTPARVAEMAATHRHYLESGAPDDVLMSSGLYGAALAITDLIAKQEAINKEHEAGHEQMFHQWNRLQDLLQAREATIAKQEAEIEELRRVSEILSRYVCNNLGSSLLAMCQAELSGTYKPLEAKP